MAIGSGLGGSLGIGVETTYGTAVTVTRFYEFNSESLVYRKNVVEGRGLRGGGVFPRSARRVVTTYDAGGEITMDLPEDGLGLLLAHATGTAASAVTTTTGVYTFTFTPADTYGKSLTVQVGAPQLNGTVVPLTMGGAKITTLGIGVESTSIATLSATIDAKNFTTGTALTSPSYTSGNVFHFAQGAVTIDGSSVANVKSISLSLETPVKADRYNLGSSGAKAEPTINDFRSVSGSMTLEFTDTTVMDKIISDASAALVLTFTGSTITGAYKKSLSISLPVIKFDTDTVQVPGPDALELSVAFRTYDNGYTITYVSDSSSL